MSYVKPRIQCFITLKHIRMRVRLYTHYWVNLSLTKYKLNNIAANLESLFIIMVYQVHILVYYEGAQETSGYSTLPRT